MADGTSGSGGQSRRIAIIGAGPIGLEAAVYALQLGFDVVVYDKGDIGHAVRSWGFVRMFTPWSMTMTPLARSLLRGQSWQEPSAEERPTGHEFCERYVMPLAQLPSLRDRLRLQHQVIALGKEDELPRPGQPEHASLPGPFRILLKDATGRERIDTADVILDCSGTYGNHRWAGRGGIPAPGELALQHRIWYTIPDVLGRDRELFANRHTLLLGCGFSAAYVLQCAAELHSTASQTRITWAIRRPGQALQAVHGDPLQARRELVQQTLRLTHAPPAWLQFVGTCILESVSSADDTIAASLRSMQTSLQIQVDEVVALVGFTPDASLSEQLQIYQCYATGGPIRLIGEPGVLPKLQPNFFVLGAKSYGNNSGFMLPIGHKQVVDAFKMLCEDTKLDLYASHVAQV